MDAATVIAIAPDDPQGYRLAAQTHATGGAYDKAVADAEQTIKLAPRNLGDYLLLANILRAAGRGDDSLAVAPRLVAANPDDAEAHVFAGAIYGRFHKDADAKREFDRSIAIKPTVSAYLTRLEYRPRGDLAGRQADIDAARRLEPGSPDVVKQQVKLDERAGRYDKVIAELAPVLGHKPNDVDALVSRGIAYDRSGHPAEATADFAAARKIASDPVSLNNQCWRKATANAALASALADCDASLAASPTNAETLDSRGYVLLRLKRWDEALTAYDRSLAARPKLATSLYGRSLARAAKGDSAGAAADRSAALKIDPEVAATFE